MTSKIFVSEDDFEIDLGGGNYLPILDFGEQNEYYITYGHIPFDEMIGYCTSHIEFIGEDLEDYNLSEEDVSWRWAVAIEPTDNDNSRTHFGLRWHEVGPDTDGSFPITLVSVW